MSPKLSLVPVPTRGAAKVTRTKVDTILVTPDIIKTWLVPPFQRPVRVNQKVIELSLAMRENDGVFPGILTIGALDERMYIVDGQHRIEAFKLSELQEGYSDVCFHYYETMEDMAEAFVNLNSQLVKMRPDDVLRGLEPMSPALKLIRKQCPYVGYDQIRRSERAPIVSMSAVLRCWLASEHDVPSSSHARGSAAVVARTFTVDEAAKMIEFLQCAHNAWSVDPEYARLWGRLNMTISMWTYRRVVLSAGVRGVTVQINREVFTKCLRSLSTSGPYLDWLVGRQMCERERSPCYKRIRDTFVRVLTEELGKKVRMPAPEWFAHSGHAVAL